MTGISRFEAVPAKLSQGLFPKLGVIIMRFEGVIPAGFSVGSVIPKSLYRRPRFNPILPKLGNLELCLILYFSYTPNLSENPARSTFKTYAESDALLLLLTMPPPWPKPRPSLSWIMAEPLPSSSLALLQYFLRRAAKGVHLKTCVRSRLASAQNPPVISSLSQQ